MIGELTASHLVWLDGQYVPWREATMYLWDHHYGVGVFEGVRAYGFGDQTTVFRLQAHTRRLFDSARILKLRIPQRWDAESLNDVQVDLLRRNGLREAYIRPFVYYGGTLGLRPSTRDLKVHVAVMALPWSSSPEADEKRLARGVSLRTAAGARGGSGGNLCKAKANATYMIGMLAAQDAQESGVDDVLLLDQTGLLTETSGANLFVVRDGVLYTPSRELVLEGITRDSVISLAHDLGLTVREARLTREDLYVADEAFLTGTASEVTPIREVDGRRMGDGVPGPITQQIREIYLSHARGVPPYRSNWLTRV